MINTTGFGFRLGFMVTSGAQDVAEALHPWFGWIHGEAFSQQAIQLFLSLVFVAIACILMGAGLPTTALYIMLAALYFPLRVVTALAGLLLVGPSGGSDLLGSAVLAPGLLLQLWSKRRQAASAPETPRPGAEQANPIDR